MICPLCRTRAGVGVTVCPACGVDFLKWLHLQGGKARGAGRRMPQVRSRGLGPAGWAAAGALAAAALLLALWRISPPAPAASRSLAPAPAAPAAAGAGRLSDIHAQALAEGRLYGVELMRDELERRYDQGARAFSDEALAAAGPEAGLTPPVESPLRDDEPALLAKCRGSRGWSYGALPARPEAGAECWAAAKGYPRRWVRQQWQPKRRAWSAYPEADAARTARLILRRDYSAEREQDLRDAATAALGRAGADRRRALLDYYGFLAEREAALAALRAY